MSNNYCKSKVTLHLKPIQQKNNILAQIDKAAKRTPLCHASSQGSMAEVINIMHDCYILEKTKRKKQLSL